MSNSKAALKWLAREPTLTSAHVEYEHTEGTGQWLFARPEMRHWLDDSNARMLWVQGNLGERLLVKRVTEPPLGTTEITS